LQIRYLTHTILVVEAYLRDLPKYQLEHLGQQAQHPIKAVPEDTKIRFLTHESNIQAWIVRRSN